MVNVVFHTAFVGDLLLSIPFLQALKQRFPERDIILVTRPHVSDFFLHHGLAQQVIELDKKSSASIREFRKCIQSYEIDMLFCPHQSFRSAWLLRGLKAGKKIAYTNMWSRLFFQNLVKRDLQRPEVLRLMDLLATVDPQTEKKMSDIRLQNKFLAPYERQSIRHWPDPIPLEWNMKVPVQTSDREAVGQLGLRSPYVLVAPSSQWLTKRWALSEYSELVGRLNQQGLHVYVVGSSLESEYCSDFVMQTQKQNLNSSYELRSLAGQTNFVDLHAIMSDAKCVYANDSGPMHMACVAGVPVVAVFGPTTLDLGYRPWSNMSAVAQVDLPCRPCGAHGHNRCPINTHDCMKKVAAEQVFDLSKKWVAKT